MSYRTLVWIYMSEYEDEFDDLHDAIIGLYYGAEEGRHSEVGILDANENTIYVDNMPPFYYGNVAEMMEHFKLKDPIIKLWEYNDKNGEITYSDPPSDILKLVKKAKQCGLQELPQNYKL